MATLTHPPKGTLMLASGLALGSAGMYFLDPARGKRRRAVFRGKALQALKEVRTGAETAAGDARNRMFGVIAETLSLAGHREVSDEILVARIRAKLGHLVRYPALIEVKAEGGVVTLRGDVLESDAEKLPLAVAAVPGVVEVQNNTQAWQNPEQIPGFHPALRGNGVSSRRRWTPAMRLLATGAGGASVILGARQKGFWGLTLSLLGTGLITRGIGNRGLKEITGLSDEGIAVQKSITIQAPVSDLYEFWSDPQNYPRVFSHVHEIRKVGENHYHWKAAGPGGAVVDWEGEIARVVPNELVAWRTLPGSLVPNSGVVRLDPNYDASTRVHVRMSYHPPAGTLGHLVAELFGDDPKSALDEDLIRLKSLFEHGKTRVRGQPVFLQDLRLAEKPQI